MNGKGHYALGASAGLLWVQLAGLDPWQAVAAIPVSAAFAHGAISPDLDNTPLWRMLDRWTPDEALGAQGPMRHRGITHWWGLHLVLSGILYLVHGWWPWWWLGGAVLAAWWSHLLGDFLVGAASRARGPGIPLMPWWGHVGFGFRCGGWVENLVTAVVPLVMAWQAAWTLTGTSRPWALLT